MNSTKLRLAVVTVLITAPLTLLATPAQALVQVTQASAGYHFSCALTTTGSAYCWGLNDRGQLGNGTTVNSTTRVAVSGGHTFVSISSGVASTCGLLANGNAYCWGNGSDGQLGNNAFSDSSIPVLVSGGHTWESVEVGWYGTCGVTTSDAGYCWGCGVHGENGNGGSSSVSNPTAVSGGHSWNSITRGDLHTCGVTTTNVGYCWGQNARGQFGNNSTIDSTTPTPVSGGISWRRISAGGYSWDSYTCGVATNGNGYCWGDEDPHLGQGPNAGDVLVPTAVSGSHNWSTIDTGGSVTCGLTSDGTGYCWGNGDFAQMGNGTNTTSNVPTAVTATRDWTVIVEGPAGIGCGVNDLQLIYCWGFNADGGLGDGTTIDRNIPTAVVGISSEVVNSTVSAVVDPTFSLTIAGYNGGACNGAQSTQQRTPAPLST